MSAGHKMINKLNEKWKEINAKGLDYAKKKINKYMHCFLRFLSITFSIWKPLFCQPAAYEWVLMKCFVINKKHMDSLWNV